MRRLSKFLIVFSIFFAFISFFSADLLFLIQKKIEINQEIKVGCSKIKFIKPELTKLISIRHKGENSRYFGLLPLPKSFFNYGEEFAYIHDSQNKAILFSAIEEKGKYQSMIGNNKKVGSNIYTIGVFSAITSGDFVIVPDLSLSILSKSSELITDNFSFTKLEDCKY